MKRILFIVLTFISLNVFSQNEKKVFNGYDGGMMLHAGFVSKNIKPVDIKAEGVTKGIGGAIRFHFGEHYRIGTEGYVSTLSLKNTLEEGSYIKTFWAGLTNDFYWEFGKFMPYVGLIVGGACCFLPFPNAPVWAKFIIFIAGYVVWDAFYTVANVLSWKVTTTTGIRREKY